MVESQRRRRVLFLSQVLPYPLNSGPKLRAYYVLRHLATRYAVTLVAFYGDAWELQHVDHLASFCESVHPVLRQRSRVQDGLALLRSLLTGRPFMIIRHHHRVMARAVDGLLDTTTRYDLVHVDQLKMGQYVEHLDGLPKLIDKHNAYANVVKGVAETERSLLRRLVARLDWPRLARYEGWLCRQFDHVVAVTEEDRAVLQEWAGQPLDITVIPIAADPRSSEPVQRRPDATDILSVGSMFYPPNVDGTLWFAEAVYPRIKARLPSARVCLVGSRPAPAIRRLAQKDPSIEVTGYVPDLQPYLERSAVLIAPLQFGSGMRVKIIDALTREIPIVSTSLGCQGIGVTSGENILIADDPDDFADKVVQVIQNRGLADSLAANGRQLIEQEYDWRVVYQKFDEVYAGLLESAAK